MGMTNNEPTAPIDLRIDARLAAIRADAARFATPIMPAKVNRPAPRSRRHSVKHRAIR